MKNLLFFSSLLFILSCEQQSYTKEECEVLSMKSFKGHPKSSHLFKTHCKDFKLTYTASYCQKALKELILTGNEEYLKKKYGSKILSCFTKNDLKSFLKTK